MRSALAHAAIALFVGACGSRSALGEPSTSDAVSLDAAAPDTAAPPDAAADDAPTKRCATPAITSGWIDATSALGAVNFTGVWGSGECDVWAVGDIGIAHFDGDAWTISERAADAHLRAIFGTGSQDAWAVGADVLHWDGTTWSSHAPPGWGGGGIGGFSAARDDAWLLTVSAEGRHCFGDTLHWDGRAWTSFSQTYRCVVSAWGAAANDVWGVGLSWETWPRYALIRHWDGAKWSDVAGYGSYTQGLQFFGDAYAVSGSGANDVWIVGSVTATDAPSPDGGPPGPLAVRWDGARWSTVRVPEPLSVVRARAPNDVWALSSSGAALYHFDGTRWTLARSGSPLTALWIGPESTWAVGTGGVVLRNVSR